MLQFFEVWGSVRSLVSQFEVLYAFFKPKRRDNFDVQFLSFDQRFLSAPAPYEVGDRLNQFIKYPAAKFKGPILEIPVNGLTVVQNLEVEYQVLE